MNKKTYNYIRNVGERTPVSGMYICVPCGYLCHFKKGDTLPQCFSCLIGKKLGDDDYMKDLGLWELKKEDD